MPEASIHFGPNIATKPVFFYNLLFEKLDYAKYLFENRLLNLANRIYYIYSATGDYNYSYKFKYTLPRWDNS